MIEVKFKIRHKGCWSNHFNKISQTAFVSYQTFILKEGKTYDIIHIIDKNNNHFDDMVLFLKKYRTIGKMDVLFEDRENIYIQIFRHMTSVRSIIFTIMRYGGFVTKPVIVKQGLEYWSFVIPNKAQLDTLLIELKKCGDFKLLGIKSNIGIGGPDFSFRQKHILETAIQLGYYSWPRKISARQLAARFKISSATLLQHLRTAEMKLITNK